MPRLTINRCSRRGRAKRPRQQSVIHRIT